MLSAFRRLSKSAFGSILLILFLIAIAASFDLADMSNVGSGTFGSGGKGLVEVGDEEITDRDMDSAMRLVLQQAQRQNPEATYSAMAEWASALTHGAPGRADTPSVIRSP